ncbi:MAG: polyprenyl synthetase family protein [Chloroflexi bacterium]|nr:polyprenyl synthetase family protein [Chloroflexota bacterium]
MQATSIYTPVHEGLERVEDKLRAMPDLGNPFLGRLLGHVFDTSGKRVRPAITLLAAGFHAHDPPTIETMAAAVELLHIATLIHDDTVDDSDVRRGKATVGSLWGRKAAVLVGDYIFAASATFVCDTGNVRVIRRFSETIMELSSGELQEMAESYSADQTKEQYFSRIYNKTASLFTTAGESGAILSGAPESSVDALREYARSLGMAFQIVDDILDFNASEEEVGKPVGNDLSLGILTLPSIIAMEGCTDANPIRDLFQQPHDPVHLERAVDLVQNSSGIKESYACAEEYCGRALDALKSLPSNPSRDSLEELIRYVLDRRG